MTGTAYSEQGLKDLELAISELTLPIGDFLGDSVLASALAMEGQGLSLLDQPLTVRRVAAEWRANGAAPALLREVVSTALAASSDEHARKLATRYFDLHEKLRSKLAMTFRGATVITGYAALIASLALDHSMSAAQIATLLRSRGVDDDTATWAAVQEVLAAMSSAPSFTTEQMAIQIQEDVQGEETLFADADWRGSLELMAGLAQDLGLAHDIAADLAEIVPETGEAHWPYVFMLHFSCVPLDWYDHSPVFLYEFSPRGESADLLLEIYEGFDTGSNPFLNNAKSVDRADQNWADSKVRMKLRAPASALVSLLEEAGSLPFQTKRTFGAAVRQWCLRQLRLHRVPLRLLDRDSFTQTQLGLFLRKVAASETNTKGIIEQRLVDALAATKHSGPEWRPRGLGDSVNAANTPRRKLGDCEFQDVSLRVVEAYEAHAGHLSDVYLRNHLASLKGVIRSRIDDEWLPISEPSDWTVNVRFVAHSTDLGLPSEDEIESVRVRLHVMTYEDLIADIELDDPIFWSAFGHWGFNVLNQARTPQTVRDKVLDIIG